VNNNVLNRKMFQMGGPVIADPAMNMQPPPMQPPPVASQGIMTGIEDPQTEGGLTSVAEDLQQVMAEIDGAENYEGIMNALRGDQATIEQRRQELAQYVGNADSVKTPESVLALTQPVVEILKVTEQAETDQMGGIASLGDPTVNFNQASVTQSPGLDEASMRIAQGEQFVQRANGSPPMGEIINPATNFLAFSKAASPYEAIKNPFELGLNYQTDYDTILNTVRGAMESQKPDSLTDQITAAENIGLGAPTARPADEILKTYQKAFGDDKNYNDLMSNLNLVQASTGLMQDTRPFAEAVGGALEKYATGAIELAQQRKENDRTLKLAAIQANEKEVLADVERKQNALTNVYDAHQNQTNTYHAAMLKTAGDAMTEVGKNQRDQLQEANKIYLAEQAYRESQAGKPPLSFINDTTGDIIDVRRVDSYTNGNVAYSGLAKVDTETGTLVPVPEGYRMIESSELAKRLDTSGVNGFKDAKSVKMTLAVTPTKENPAKFKNIFTGVEVNGQYFYRPITVGANGVETFGNFEPIPVNMIPNAYSEDFEEIIESDTGFTIKLTDPFDGSQTYRKTHLTNSVTGTTIADDLSQRRLKALEVGKTGSGYTGTPFVVADENVPQPNMLGSADKELISKQLQNLSYIDSFTTSAKQLFSNEAFEYTAGVVAGLRNTSNYIVAPFSAILGSDWASWSASPAAQNLIKQMKRDYIGANALSDRYAVAEQERLSNMIGGDEDEIVRWMNSPELAESEFRELLRGMENRRQEIIGFVTSQPVQRIMQVPSGQSDQPFDLSEVHHRVYVENHLGTYENLSTKGKKEFTERLEDKFIRVDLDNLKAIGDNLPKDSSYDNQRSQINRIANSYGSGSQTIPMLDYYKLDLK